MEKSFNLSHILLNLIFLLFPLTFILGNTVTNLNIILIIFSTIFFYKKKFNFSFNFFDKIIFIFFIYTFLTLIINYYESYLNNIKFPSLIINKTILYFRYFLLYITIRFLFEQKILNLKWFLISCSLLSFYVCFDIFFQYLFGVNTLGYDAKFQLHYSGIFQSELIAGGYLQRFSIFIFFLPFVYKKNLLQILFFIFFCGGVILSGNRMPFILFILSVLIISFINFNFKQILNVLASILIVFLVFFFFHKPFKKNMYNLYYSTNTIFETFFKSSNEMLNEPLKVWQRPYVTEFFCGKENIKENPIFGGGIRSYRIGKNCNTHPHNYYLEILSDLGIVGLVILIILLFKVLQKILFLKNNFFNKTGKSKFVYLMPFLINIFIEFFPLRTSGSFFSTNNSAFIFILFAIIISLLEEEEKLKSG